MALLGAIALFGPGGCSSKKEQGSGGGGGTTTTSDTTGSGTTTDSTTGSSSGSGGGTGGTSSSSSGAGGEEKLCSCSTPGVEFVPVSGCDGWPDADQCTGFHSTYCADEECHGGGGGGGGAGGGCAFGEDTLVADGTACDGYGCIIKIVCP
jgi:hypothetical protein